MVVDTVLYNAKLYCKKQILTGGIAIDDGMIFQLGKEANLPSADRRIDLRGLLILPGLVDVHVHLRDQLKIVDEDFGVDVTVSVQFIEGDYQDFKHQIYDQSHGQIDPEVIEQNPNSIMPV